MALFDFHMHTFLSDGELLPAELARRCIVNGYTAMAITDHASSSNVRFLAESVVREAELLQRLASGPWPASSRSARSTASCYGASQIGRASCRERV